jgi:hypothetical protein
MIVCHDCRGGPFQQMFAMAQDMTLGKFRSIMVCSAEPSCVVPIDQPGGDCRWQLPGNMQLKTLNGL